MLCDGWFTGVFFSLHWNLSPISDKLPNHIQPRAGMWAPYSRCWADQRYRFEDGTEMKERPWKAATVWIAMTIMIPGTRGIASQRPAAEETGSPVKQGHPLFSSLAPHFGLTQIYQQNVHGGLSTSERDGRYAGSYDLESTLDLESLVGLENAGLYILVEGGWPEAGSIR